MKFGIKTPQWFFQEEGAGGGGGGEEAGKVLPSKLVEKYNGDAVKMAEKLADVLTDNYNYRKKMPPEGAVILTGEDAKRWAVFAELGEPADVKKRLEEAATAATERDELKAEKVIARAAELAGFKPDVLADLAKSKSFALEVEGEGEAARAVARWKDGDRDASKPLSEYAESSLAMFLPSLRAEAAPTAPTRAPGVPFPKAAPIGGGKPPSLAEQIRAEEAAAKAPVGAIGAGTEAVKVPSLEERMNMARG